MTKTELTRLTRKAMAVGHFSTKKHEAKFYCPVHREALDAVRDRSLPHMFDVVTMPWEDASTRPAVMKALASHLEDAEVNGEPCDDLSKAEPRR